MNKLIAFLPLCAFINIQLAGMESTIGSPELLLKYSPKSWAPYVVTQEKFQNTWYNILQPHNKLDLRDQNGDTICLALIKCAKLQTNKKPWAPDANHLHVLGMLNDTNNAQETALMLLCQSEYDWPKTILKYLNYGAKTDLQDIKGETALIKAIKAKRTLHANTLLNIAPAQDILIQNKKGKTAFDYAIDTNDKPLIKRLVESLLNIQEQVSLTYCIKHDNKDMLEFLMTHGIVPTNHEIQYAKDTMNPLLADYLTDIQQYYRHYSNPDSPDFSNFLKQSTFKKSLLLIALKLHHTDTLSTLTRHDHALIKTLDSSLQHAILREAVLQNATQVLDYCIQQGGKTYQDILEVCLKEDSADAVGYALTHILPIYPTMPSQLQEYEQRSHEHWAQNSKLDLFCNPYLYCLVTYSQPKKTEIETKLQDAYDTQCTTYNKVKNVYQKFRERALTRKSDRVVKSYDEFITKHESNA